MALSDTQALLFGHDIIELLGVKEKNDLYKTAFGNKTALGIGRTMESLYLANVADTQVTLSNSQF
jgi:hypothetical protein